MAEKETKRINKKYILLLLAFLIISLVVLLFIPESESQNSSFFSSLFMSKEEASVNDYVENMRAKQNMEQRDNTIKLYVKTLERGYNNRDKTQSPSEAPEVCEMAKEIIKSPSKIEQAEELANYLSLETEYDWGNVILDTTGRPKIKSKKSPTQVLEQKKGLCGELANTLLLMGECLDIPVYTISGGGHKWNAFVSETAVIEIDTTQGCFDCKAESRIPELPVVRLCDTSKCITLEQVTSVLAG